MEGVDFGGDADDDQYLSAPSTANINSCVAFVDQYRVGLHHNHNFSLVDHYVCGMYFYNFRAIGNRDNHIADS